MMQTWITRRKGRGKGSGWRYLVRWQTPDGAFHQRAAGTNKRAAKTAQAEVWRELSGLAPPRPTGGSTDWADFMEEDEAAIRSLLAPATVMSTRKVLEIFGRVTGVTHPEAVTVQMIEDYRTCRLAGGMADGRRIKAVRQTTVNRDLRHLKAAFNRAIRRGTLKTNPFLAVKQARIPERTKRVLADDEEGKLLKACAGLPTMRALVMTGLHTGARLGELLALQWTDVNLSSGAVYIRCYADHPTKSRRNRWTSVGPDSLAALRELNRTSSGAHVFRSDPEPRGYYRRIQGDFDLAVKNAKIERCTLHDLRRTCLTRLAESGVPPAVLQEYAGHQSIVTTMTHYVGVRAARVLEAVAEARRTSRPSPLRPT